MIVVILGVPIAAFAQTHTLTLAWDSNSQPIDHFNVYVGTQPGVHNVGVHSVPGFQSAYSFTVTPGTLLFFAVSAVDVDGVESQLSAELKCAVPVLVQPSNQTGTAGVAVTPLVLTASDPGGGQLQFTATGLPAGLVINGATGVISGTPTTAGASTVTVSVDNGVVTTAQSFTWTIAAAPVVATVSLSITPSSGSGATGNFTAQYTDSLGAADLATVYLNFSTTSSATASSCSVSYRPSTNQLSLRDDSGNVWQSGPIGWGTLQNSQCTVDLAASSASISGQTLSVAVALAFTASYGGAKNIYSYATTTSGVETGWQTVGSWTIPGSSSISALSTISVTPSDGFGAAQTFAAKFMAPSGATSIALAYVKFSVLANGAFNTCTVRYEGASGLLSLRDDAGVWQPGSVAGGSDVQHNTQCRLLLAGSSIAIAGQVLTMNVAMKFSPLFAGEKKSYLYATSTTGVNVGWREHGSWMVPSDPQPSISNGSLNPASGMGTTQIFSARYYDAPGGDTVAKAYLRFGPDLSSAAHSCVLVYDKQTQRLWLRNDAGQWGEPFLVSAAGSPQNSQCVISLAQSSASFSNSVLTLNVAVTFKASYAGPKNAYLKAVGQSGAATGWELRGSWSIPSSGSNAPVSAGAVTPNSGSGTTQTFTAQFMDTLGANDLAAVYFKASSAPRSALNTCMIRYEPTTGVALRDDDGRWLPGISINAGGQLQNTQCAISVGAGSVTMSGNTLTLTVTVTFTPSYQGAKNVYLLATTIAGYVTDWQQRGTWIIP